MSLRVNSEPATRPAGSVAGLFGVAAILLGLAALVGSVGYVISVSRPTKL